MDIGRRDIFVVGTTTAIGFVGNVVSYSVKLPKSKGERFGFSFPRGLELTYVLLTGFVAGIVINKVLGLIEDSLKTKEEILLDEAYAEAKRRAQKGDVSGRSPIIDWKA